MNGRVSRLAVLAAGLLAPAAALAQETVPLPKADPRLDPAKLAAQKISDACDGEAVAVRIADKPDAAQTPTNLGVIAPFAERQKDAQSTANVLGRGVEGEADSDGQTLSWARGRVTKKDCRAKLHRLERSFPGRVSFEPTTEERVAEVQRRRDAMIPANLRKKPADAGAAAGFFDGSNWIGGGFFTQTAAQIRPELPTAQQDPKTRNWAADARASYQLPTTLRRASFAPPEPASYGAPSFGQTVISTYERGKSYVSDKLDEAGRWVTGVTRSVQNRFFSGIELIQGYGYTLIHAGRETNWGTKPMVDGIRRIAAYMRGTGLADTDFAVGDISSARGGQLGGHLSHRKGRDADLGFYMIDAQTGKPIQAQSFVTFASGRDGLTGRLDGRSVRFDAARNWEFVKAILSNPDPNFKPTNIFIAKHLEKAILAAAGNDPLKAKAAGLMSYWPGHENHLHLRVE